MANVGRAVVNVAPRRDWPRTVLGVLLVLAVGLVTLGPILVVVAGSFEGNAWSDILFDSPLTREALGTSLILALRAPFAALIGFLIAWLLIRFPIPGRTYLEFGFWLVFFLPLVPLTLGWMLMLDRHDGLLNQAVKLLPFVRESVFDINTISGILWVHMSAASVPVMIILLGPAIRRLDSSFEDAARVCGSAPAGVFRRVTLPLLMTAILTGTVLGFIRGLEAFEVEQLLGAPAKIYVYTTRVYALVNWEPPRFAEAMALSTFVLIFLMAMAYLYQRFTRKSRYATITGSGMSVRQMSIGRARWVISAILFLILFIIGIVPMICLIVGSFMTIFGFFGVEHPYTLKHWQTVLGDRNFLGALYNSVVLGLGAAGFGVLVYAGLAYLVVRSRLVGRGLVEYLAWLPWCVPGILLGVGLLALVLHNPVFRPLYGSLAILIFAIIVSQIPLGVTMMKTAVIQISPELEHASRVSGAGAFTTFRRIVLPLMRPMLISVFILVLIAGLRDISTVLLLSQAGSQPLSVLMLEYAAAGTHEPAAALGIIVASIIVAFALLARLGGLNLTQSR